ncbi:hypothetical protein NE237_024304 [Protea cynaroides]|uniref:HMA domain-containing protein n=1 Tax=Protea cynaroides TaxID=273540 RepID=A0A9Q0HEL6_9MAGN|nr:hypothetical protein NE237_024304 [Protea cynaroides]
MDNCLYNEFGNYVGPEIESSRDSNAGEEDEDIRNKVDEEAAASDDDNTTIALAGWITTINDVDMDNQFEKLQRYSTKTSEAEMGALDHLSEYFDFTSLRSSKKHNKSKQLETVEIKVKMDCEGCERRVEKAVKGMNGVTQVDIEPKKHKLTVIGYVDPKKVLKRVQRRTGKKAEFWPYVPYDEVAHPYAAGSYDKKAPAGYVRNAMNNPEASRLARASTMEEKYSNTFSDENPNACSVM